MAEAYLTVEALRRGESLRLLKTIFLEMCMYIWMESNEEEYNQGKRDKKRREDGRGGMGVVWWF